jgi:hypothetical protein
VGVDGIRLCTELLLTDRNVWLITGILTSELNLRVLVLFGHVGGVRNVHEIVTEIHEGKSFYVFINCNWVVTR